MYIGVGPVPHQNFLEVAKTYFAGGESGGVLEVWVGLLYEARTVWKFRIRLQETMFDQIRAVLGSLE